MSIAAVKIAQKEAGITDAEYRRILYETAQVCSAKELDEPGCRRVVAALRRARPKKPVEGKIWALWYDLKPLLPEAQRTSAYLFGFCRRAARRHAPLYDLGDLSPSEAYKVVEALIARLDDLDAVPF